MRLIFAGTPVFAQAALQAIIDAGFDVVLVLTREDQPAGRGQRLQPSPVKQTALAKSIPVLQPKTLRESAVVQALTDYDSDVMVVAAYGRILPPEVLKLPRFGCLNIHASLLPRWRGAAPIQRAIEAGDSQTGITIMQMDAGLDTGPILSKHTIPISLDETSASLHDRLQGIGAQSIVAALKALQAGELRPQTQPESGVTYAKKIEKSEAMLDWTKTADQLCNQIRAFDPFPGCVTPSPLEPNTAGSPPLIKVFRAQVLAEPLTPVVAPATAPGTAPGTVIALDSTRLVVQSGAGTQLVIREMQKPGGKRMPVGEFLKGFVLRVGDCFGGSVKRSDRSDKNV